MEWTTGHPGTKACVLVFHASHESKSHVHDRGLCKQYIEEAPPEAFKWKNNPRFKRMHWSCAHGQGKDNFKAGAKVDCPAKSWNGGPEDYPDVYSRIVPEDDDIYITRERGWNDPKFTDDEISKKSLFAYTENSLQVDARAEYTNPRWPWIEAVHYFMINSPPGLGAREWDTARFAITGKSGPGQYIMHSMWGGYTDAMDVDLFPLQQSPTPDPYGAFLTEAWVKTEHCHYPVYDVSKQNQCYFFEADAPDAEAIVQECLDWCFNSIRNRCDAVNVVPVLQPKNVRHQNLKPNTPWNKDNIQHSRLWNKPSGNWDVNVWPTSFIHKTCKTENHPTFTEKTMTCYGLFARTPWIEDRAWNQETERFFYVRKDPQDPIFYSTCYRLEREAEFSPSNGVCEECSQGNIPQSQPEWEYGDMCIPCPFYERSKSTKESEILLWPTQSENCVKCA